MALQGNRLSALGRQNSQPQYGLSGAENAINTGVRGGGFLLGQGQNALANQPAQNLMGALSGAQGQQAFDQARINSPVQSFLKQQGEESIVNQNSATGGLGGGQVQKELARFGQGLAGQQLQQQIGNLRDVTSQNIQQGGQRAQLFGQGANMLSNAGSNIAQSRFQTGRDLSTNIGNATSGLSNLASQQGSGLSGIIGGSSSNIANLLSGAGQFDAQQQTQLATMLANLATNEGSQQASYSIQQGNNAANSTLNQGSNYSNLLGNLGNAYAYNQGMPTNQQANNFDPYNRYA